MELDPTDYECLAQIYIQRSALFEIYYSDRLKTAQAFIILDGIITQLNSDIAVYVLKHGKNGKIKEVIERVKGLTLIHDHFKGIDERNFKMRLQLQDNFRRMEELKKENEQLQRELKGI